MHVIVGDYCIVTRFNHHEDTMVQVTKVIEYVDLFNRKSKVYTAEFENGESREFGGHMILRKYSENCFDDLLTNLTNI